MDEKVKLSLEQFAEVETWTNDEWLAVLNNIPPQMGVDFGIEFVRKLRSERGTGITEDGASSI